jgi:hypothetical protein
MQKKTAKVVVGKITAGCVGSGRVRKDSRALGFELRLMKVPHDLPRAVG